MHSTAFFGSTSLDVIPETEVEGTTLFGRWYPGWDNAPQLFDLAVLQYLYGPNPAERAGNDTYIPILAAYDPSVDPDQNVPLLWDGGGTDTIDLSTGAGPARAGLAPGQVYQVGTTNTGILDSGTFAINYHSVFERLIGTVFDDQLSGSAGDDYILGNKGDDQLRGGSGVNELWGEEGLDRFYLGVGDGPSRLNDFDFANEKIIIDPGFGLSSVSDVLSLLTNPVSNVSELILSGQATAFIFHNNTGSKLSATNIEFGVLPSTATGPTTVTVIPTLTITFEDGFDSHQGSFSRISADPNGNADVDYSSAAIEVAMREGWKSWFDLMPDAQFSENANIEIKVVYEADDVSTVAGINFPSVQDASYPAAVPSVFHELLTGIDINYAEFDATIGVGAGLGTPHVGISGVMAHEFGHAFGFYDDYRNTVFYNLVLDGFFLGENAILSHGGPVPEQGRGHIAPPAASIMGGNSGVVTLLDIAILKDLGFYVRDNSVNDTPTGSVTITGTVSQGETLTANTSSLRDPDTLGSFNFVWLRDGTPISGATASSYGLTQEDVGAQISMQVSYTDGGGTVESVTSDPTQAVTDINDDTFEGDDGDNTFSGGDGVDKISGGLGNDTIRASPGNDLIDGGEGIDTAIYSGNQTSYTLTLGPSSTIMTDRTGTEGTDTLVDIEKLTFADRTLDLDNYSSLTQLNDAQFSDLAKVYVAYFNRAADAEGLYFWADKLAEGMDMATIASYFSQSAEAKALYPNTANTSAFVTAVYANVLGRTPDQAGFDFWTTNLNNGAMQPATFVLSIIGGAQGADITYLSNKADLGVYFSAIKGMSDGVDAQNVLNIFGDQSTSNTAGAKASVDGHFTDATASGSGEFIFELVGIVNDPFADVI